VPRNQKKELCANKNMPKYVTKGHATVVLKPVNVISSTVSAATVEILH
jgi:uncharacterized protein YsxB (DUF464 family)